MTVKVNVGSKIRQIRELRNVSASELAPVVHLTNEQLEAIESNQTIPGLGILIRIARALGVRLGTFLDDQELSGPALVRANEYHETLNYANQKDNSGYLNFFSLAPDKNNRSMEPFVITIDPAASEISGFSSHEGEEFLYVLSGQVEVKYGKDTHILNTGDSIYIDSIVEHRISSNTNEQAKAMVVIYVPF